MIPAQLADGEMGGRGVCVFHRLSVAEMRPLQGSFPPHRTGLRPAEPCGDGDKHLCEQLWCKGTQTWEPDSVGGGGHV